LSLAGPGFMDSRAWWLIDLEHIAAASQSPEGRRALAQEIPEGLDTARRQLRATVEGVATRTELPIGRIVLGGFSQGSMLATDLALRLEEAPAGLLIFSGTLQCARAGS
jgi:phospholipase/carboxylesterase